MGLLGSLLILVAVSSLHTSEGGTINVINNCPHTVWVGTNGQKEQNGFKWSDPELGGFQLNQGSRRTLYVEEGWAGRVWGRTNCDGAGRCETGQCWNGIQCRGQSGRPPATLAEFKFDGWDGLNFYAVILVDGFNLRMRLKPIGGSGECKEGSCTFDMNSRCPQELQVKNGRGQVVGCDSKGGTQRFRDYAAEVCRNAYGFWNDDTKTYSCRSAGRAQGTFELNFC